MRSKFALAFLPAIALTLGACAGSVSGPTGPAATQPVAVATLPATITPEDTSQPAGSEPAESPEASGGQATPSPTDPCSLLTQDEASTLMGVTLGAGVSTLVDIDRVCTWKKGLTEVKLFLAPLAPDAATAQAYWDAERAQVPGGFPIADLADFDRSAYGSGAYKGYSISALFAIKGTQFFDLYCGFPKCSVAATLTAAHLIGDRLP